MASKEEERFQESNVGHWRPDYVETRKKNTVFSFQEGHPLAKWYDDVRLKFEPRKKIPILGRLWGKTLVQIRLVMKNRIPNPDYKPEKGASATNPRNRFIHRSFILNPHGLSVIENDRNERVPTEDEVQQVRDAVEQALALHPNPEVLKTFRSWKPTQGKEVTG